MSHDNRMLPSCWVDVTPGTTNHENLIGFRVTGNTGNVAVVFENGNAFTFKNVAQGDQRLGLIKQIVASGTTATVIEGARA